MSDQDNVINLDKNLKQRVITIKIESLTDELDPSGLVYRMIDKILPQSTIDKPSMFSCASNAERYYVDCVIETKAFDFDFINRDKK